MKMKHKGSTYKVIKIENGKVLLDFYVTEKLTLPVFWTYKQFKKRLGPDMTPKQRAILAIGESNINWPY